MNSNHPLHRGKFDLPVKTTSSLQRNHPDLNADLEPGGVRFFFMSVKGRTVIASYFF
jgi:hypothetical protein